MPDSIFDTPVSELFALVKPEVISASPSPRPGNAHRYPQVVNAKRDYSLLSVLLKMAEVRSVNCAPSSGAYSGPKNRLI